jgi:hypothetical protein
MYTYSLITKLRLRLGVTRHVGVVAVWVLRVGGPESLRIPLYWTRLENSTKMLHWPRRRNFYAECKENLPLPSGCVKLWLSADIHIQPVDEAGILRASDGFQARTWLLPRSRIRVSGTTPMHHVRPHFSAQTA